MFQPGVCDISTSRIVVPVENGQTAFV